MKGKTTLKDLARVLNLSVSTISKALNNSTEISEATRIKIKEAALKHHYTPNRLAQSLKANKTNTIGVIVPDLLAHFFAKAIHGIETTASKYGFNVIICLSNDSLDKEAKSLETLINGNVDGVILSLSKETQHLESYVHFEDAIKYNLPVVLFDRTTSRLICDKISINDKLAAKEATNHLLNTGCLAPIFLSTIHGTSVGERRNLGYEEALQEAGIECFSLNILNYQTFEKDLLKVLHSRKVDGVLAADELSAVSVMRYALKNDYRIPEDLAVIGFTNGQLGENFVPSLTTVEQSAEEQGSMAADILIRRIEKEIPVEPIERVLDTMVIERESTKRL